MNVSVQLVPMEPTHKGEDGSHKSLGAIVHSQASKITALEAVGELYAEARQSKLQNPMREHGSECERS